MFRLGARQAMTLNRGVVAMCAAQACAQIGAFGVAALLPMLIAAWSLSNTEAGWISGIYYAAYTLAVPLLSSLTDRVDPKRVYLGSVALTAMAFAGLAPAGRSGRRSVGGGGHPRTLEPDVRRASIRAGLLPLGSEGPPPRRHLTGEQ